MNTENLNGFAISEQCYKWILDNFEKGSTILELGSGTGTVELTKDFKVYSIENNKDWVGYAPDSTYIHSPLIDYKDQWGTYQWYDKEYITPYLPATYDLLLVDAPTGSGRRGILSNLDIFHLEVPIIVDDTHRPEEKFVASKLANILNKGCYEYAGNEKSFCVIE
jgi:hypothetical protein